MLIGHRSEQNERQKKLRKSQIYKEMLDNQILMNQHIKRRRTPSNLWKETDHHGEISALSKHPEALDNSFVRDIDLRHFRQKKRLLPSIRDKNTFYRGSSKFLKIEEPTKPSKQHRHVYTEEIQEEDDEIGDQYNSTCEKIIRELQNISNKHAKMRPKKRTQNKTGLGIESRYENKPTYEGSYPTKNANGSPKQRVKWQDESISQQGFKANRFNDISQRQIKYSNSQGQKKSVQGPEVHPFPQKNKNNYSISSDFKNQFSEEEPVQSNYDKMQRATSFQQPNSSNRAEEKLKKKEEGQPRNQKSQHQDRKIDKSQSSIFENKKFDGEKTQTQSNQKSQKQDSNNKKIDKEIEEAKRRAEERKQANRSNFLQLLRKVKKRGESLYLKVAKQPSELQHDRQQ